MEDGAKNQQPHGAREGARYAQDKMDPIFHAAQCRLKPWGLYTHFYNFHIFNVQRRFRLGGAAFLAPGMKTARLRGWRAAFQAERSI